MCKLRVLIAEDHEQMRWQLVRSLSLEFDVVGSLSNGGELVDLAISLNPDVIVSDVRMPVLSGPEAMKILRRTGYNIPFVLISISSCGAEEFIGQGAAAFVEKLDIGYELAHAVRLAASGIKYLSRGVRSSIVSEPDGGCLDRS
jgi:two-component system nitrate/nitrite response regulator NarL